MRRNWVIRPELHAPRDIIGKRPDGDNELKARRRKWIREKIEIGYTHAEISDALSITRYTMELALFGRVQGVPGIRKRWDVLATIGDRKIRHTVAAKTESAAIDRVRAAYGGRHVDVVVIAV